MESSRTNKMDSDSKKIHPYKSYQAKKSKSELQENWSLHGTGRYDSAKINNALQKQNP